jgi:antibiotic biosynthesis monooxygenase (ABM) superfamily enzyme
LTFPGHLGIHVLKPAETGRRDYQFIVQFASRKQMEEFNEWPVFLQFRTAVEPLQERQPTFEELTGLETWFTLPGASVIHPLPRWKMIVLTILGIYPTSTLVNAVLKPYVEAWPWPLPGVPVVLVMVPLLTFVVMPLLTRCFRFWLYPSGAAEPASILKIAEDGRSSAGGEPVTIDGLLMTDEAAQDNPPGGRQGRLS